MNNTTTSKTSQEVSAKTQIDLTNLPSLPATLTALQFLRTAKGVNDSTIHSYLDKAYQECKKNDSVLMLERIMLHIGDVSRQHNLLKELNIKSDKGGAQERAIFRSCLRWWETNMPETFANNLHVFVEYTLYENLMYYQNTTDRFKGTHTNTEILFPLPEKVWSFLATQIRKGKDLNLIAKHLPKYNPSNSTSRTTTKIVKLKKGQTDFNYKLPKKDWVKINGEFVTGETVKLNAGDRISYPRAKKEFTRKKEQFINSWVEGLCREMDWKISDYNKFRSLQATPEQAFASKQVLKLNESDFKNMMNRLTSGQRFRISKMLAYKDTAGNLQPKDKWNQLGTWYIEWEKDQEKVADTVRAAAATGDFEKAKELSKGMHVKTTGVQTIDLLAQLDKGVYNETQINNTYQAMLEKMDLIANVFPIIDGSGSMDSKVNAPGYSISYRNVVYAMAIAFSTRNPVEKFRNTYGWFSNRFRICGRSNYVNSAPNPFVARSNFEQEVPEYEVISAGKTFTQNLDAIKRSDKGEVASTNMFSNIEFFVNLVKEGKFHVEDLPVALLYLTDNEYNAGLGPLEAHRLAASIGWHPLQIFWGITGMNESKKKEFEKVPNALFVGGFSESALSQILRGIKDGSINPETELWSIYNDPRYSVITE